MGFSGRSKPPTSSLLLLLALGAGANGCHGDINGETPDSGTMPAGDGGTTDGGGGGDGGGGDADAGLPFAPLPAGAAATKVKNLLVGLPLTDAEYRQVTGDPTTLGALIDTWMTSAQTAPLFQARMLLFFEHAFQQNQAAIPDYEALNILKPYTLRTGQMQQQFQRAMSETFPRTALQLITEGRPFNEVVTTDRYMMSTAVMSFWAYLDTRPLDDNSHTIGNETWLLTENPGISGTNVNMTIPVADSIDPSSANYMHWQFADNNIPYGTHLNGGQLLDVAMAALVNAQFTDADWSDWRMVTVHQSTGASDPKTPFWNVPTFRDPATNTLVLQTARLGFFSTPAFMANWSTNISNQDRVTANQTMIVALGTAFDDSNVTINVQSSADSAHGTDPQCIGCHTFLDPMRDMFRQSWTYNYALRSTADTADRDAGIPTMGSFQLPFARFGITTPPAQTGSGIADLARFTAGNPNFAAAWTQKLCQYANSTSCDATDPEFQRVWQDFQSHNFDFHRLIHTLFSSPLVTYASATQTANETGASTSIARRDGLCFAVSQRLENGADPCGLNAPGATSTVLENMALSVPGDGYARGVSAPLTPTDPNLFFIAGTEGICMELAVGLVDARTGARYMSSNRDTALDDLVATVMGVPPSDPRSAPLRAELLATYNDAVAHGATPTVALQTVFAIACESPTATSAGL